MLNAVRLQNFRCFKDATVRLGPLTALVGPNASGKTAFLHSITAPGFGGRSLAPRDIRQHGPKARIECTCEAPGAIQLTASGTVTSNWHHKGQYLHLDVVKIRERLRVKEAQELAPDGSNLANVLATLPRRVQEAVAQQLAELVPVLSDVDVRPTPGQEGTQRLVIQDRWNPQVWHEPEEVSDGTLLTLGILVTRHQTGGVELVAIEEPEHGLHPYLLREVVSVLRKLAGSGVQIVLATQSAELLEFLEPDEVRFLTRTAEDGSVIVEEPPTGTDDWRRTYQLYQESLGSLWLSGNLGGVPGGR